MPCEGKNDFFAVKNFLRIAGTDLDGLGVTVLDLGGSGNIADYAQIAKTLGIPWCGLTDEDLLADGTTNPQTAQRRQSLTVIKGPRDLVPMWPGDLERSLKVPAGKPASPEWQEKNVSPKSLEQLKKNYPDYCATGDVIRKWIEGV